MYDEPPTITTATTATTAYRPYKPTDRYLLCGANEADMQLLAKKLTTKRTDGLDPQFASDHAQQLGPQQL
jgi:hypothetical protein